MPGLPLPQNTYGLYNMVGNTWEWTQDIYEEAFNPMAPPREPNAPPKYVMRGGSYVDRVGDQDGRFNHQLRVTTRMGNTPDSGAPPCHNNYDLYPYLPCFKPMVP